MAKKRKKKQYAQLPDPHDVLAGGSNVTVRELVRIIHGINPTSENLPQHKKAERYRLKSNLQSFLIQHFADRIIVEQPDPDNPALVGFRLRNFDEDACHAIVNDLDENARSWTFRQIDQYESNNPVRTNTGRDKDVKSLLALAAAHCKDFDLALDFVDNMAHEKNIDIYLMAARHFIERKDADKGAWALAKTLRFNRPDKQPRIDKLKEDIRLLRRERVKPFEEQMRHAWADGRFNQAMDMARTILETLPDNKAAKLIKKSFDDRRLKQKIENLLKVADQAEKNGQFNLAVKRLEKAVRLGADAKALKNRIENAGNMAMRNLEKQILAAFESARTPGDLKNALTRYISELGDNQRRHIHNTINIPAVQWIEQILQSGSNTRPDRIINAALALDKAAADLKTGARPEEIIKSIDVHARILKAVPDADKIRQKATDRLKSVQFRETTGLLLKAETELSSMDIQNARQYLDRVKSAQMDLSLKGRYDEISARLRYLERIDLLDRKYNNAVLRGDFFTAISGAMEMIKHTPLDETRKWKDKIDDFR